MKVKIVVNKMPTVDTDCPFAIQCPNDKNYPCVCDLKRDKANMFGLNFSHHQYSNCNLSKGNPCNMLTDQMLINEV